MYKETITVKTRSRTEFVSVSNQVQAVISKWGVEDGICTLYVPHTTAGVFINEGYDPAVMRDVEAALERAVPWNAGYAHGEGNAAAHIKSILVGNSQQILVEGGRLLLGQWEEIFFAEFDGARTRRLIVSFVSG